MRALIPAAIAFLGFPLAAFGQADVTLGNEREIVVHGALTTSHPRSNHGRNDRSYHQHYLYSGVAGDSVEVAVASAVGRQMLPAAVAIYGPHGANFFADDGGRFTDPSRPFEWYASVERRLPVTGQYVICVHSHQDWATGGFVLYVDKY